MSQRQRMRDRSARSIELHIESLVVEGLARNEAAELALALQDQLTRRLQSTASPSSLTRDREATLLRAEIAAPSAPLGPRALGEQVAASLYRTLADSPCSRGPES